MKNAILLITGLLLSTFGFAQDFHIMPNIGFTFADGISVTGGTAQLSNGMNYGASMMYSFGDYNEIEFKYNRTDGNVSWQGALGVNEVSIPMSSNYLLLGYNRIIPTASIVDFYTGFKFGAGIYSPKSSGYNSYTKFAVDFTMGLKFNVSDNFAIRTAFDLYLPVMSVNAGLWWDLGSGPQIALTSSTPFVQSALNLGLDISF